MDGKNPQTLQISGTTHPTVNNTYKAISYMNLTPLPLPDIRSLTAHPFVWVVLMISCVPFLISTSQGAGQDLNAIAGWFMPRKLSNLLQPFSPWRIWTPTFVHYTFMHLFTNGYLWWLLASKVESESRFQIIALTIISATVANLLQWSIAGPNFGGLSGVVYAVFAYIWVLSRCGGKTLYSIDTKLTLVILAFIPLSATGWFGKFADWAHIGGLITGALLAYGHLKIIGQFKLPTKL